MPGFSTVTRKDQASPPARSDHARAEAAGRRPRGGGDRRGAGARWSKPPRAPSAAACPRSEIEDVPSNFRNFTALTQLIPGMTPEPGGLLVRGRPGRRPTARPRSRTSTCSTARTTTTTAWAAARARRSASCSTTSASTRCCPTATARSTAAAPAPSSTWSRAAAPTTSQAASTPTSATTSSTPAAHFLPDGAPKPDERTLQMRRSGSAARSSRTAPTSTSRSRRTTKTSPGRSVSRRRPRRWPRTSSAPSRSGR